MIAQLGGNPHTYRRERARSIRRLVAEVYSVLRVTRALKLLPSLELLPGFALDLSGEDEEGNFWDFSRIEM